MHQRIAPLGLAIEPFRQRLASAAPTSSPSPASTLAAGAWAHTAIQDDFRAGSVLQPHLSTEKLARPSFERHDAGALMSAGTPAQQREPLYLKTTDYETSYIDTPAAAPSDPDEGVPQPFPWGFIGVVMLTIRLRRTLRPSAKPATRRYTRSRKPDQEGSRTGPSSSQTQHHSTPQTNPTPTRNNL